MRTRFTRTRRYHSSTWFLRSWNTVSNTLGVRNAYEKKRLRKRPIANENDASNEREAASRDRYSGVAALRASTPEPLHNRKHVSLKADLHWSTAVERLLPCGEIERVNSFSDYRTAKRLRKAVYLNKVCPH
jgi:hypothetical protein